MTKCREITEAQKKRLTFDVRIELDSDDDRSPIVDFLRKAEASCPMSYIWARELADIIERG